MFTSPQDGVFSAVNGFDGAGPMEFRLWQDVDLQCATATLSWQHQIFWDSGEIFGTVFTLSLNSPFPGALDMGWQSTSVDVSQFAGATVRVFFREVIPEDLTGSGQFGLDAVSLSCENPDEDSHLPGPGTGPGPDRRGGTLFDIGRNRAGDALR